MKESVHVFPHIRKGKARIPVRMTEPTFFSLDYHVRKKKRPVQTQ